MRSNTLLDTRAFHPQSKLSLVRSLFDGLKEGERFEVITEQDPAGLCEHLDALQPEQLQWRFLERSPGMTWLQIEKLTPDEAGEKAKGGCCGMCGG